MNEKFRWSLSDSDPWIPGWECSSSFMTGKGKIGVYVCVRVDTVYVYSVCIVYIFVIINN